jgi:hypothetical protein
MEEDFIHREPLKSATISNHQDTVQDGQTFENPQNSITVLKQEDIIQDDEHVELNESAVEDFCQIIPTPVCTKNLMQMRHERTCHVFKGFIGKCAVCGEKFTSNKILWNAIKLWNQQCTEKMGYQVFKDDVTFHLSKEQIDKVALRISYDMEYISRHPNGTLKKMLYTIVLNRFNEHDYRHRKERFKKTSECRFHYPRTIQDNQR